MITRSKSFLLLPSSVSCTPPPSTHPMVTRSKSSLQALTTFCPSPNDIQSRKPNSIHEALLSPHWTTAVQEKLTALLDINTWSVVPLPSWRIPIGCNWLFKIKRHANGYIGRYKSQKGSLRNQASIFKRLLVLL